MAPRIRTMAWTAVSGQAHVRQTRDEAWTRAWPPIRVSLPIQVSPPIFVSSPTPASEATQAIHGVWPDATATRVPGDLADLAD